MNLLILVEDFENLYTERKKNGEDFRAFDVKLLLFDQMITFLSSW